MKSAQRYDLEGKTTLSAYNYLYNGKEFQDEMGLEVYDFHTRYYDAVIGRFMSQDPMSESMNSWSPYSFTFDNPIKFNDPTGMVPDDFFFTQSGELAAYVENDKPDRVFVAKDDQEVYENLANATDESMYNQVEMADKDLQDLMDNNGYKKVVKEETVVEKEMTTYWTDAEGGYRAVSNDAYRIGVISQNTSYIDKTFKLSNTNREFLSHARAREFKNHIKTEYPIYKYSYTYNNRGSFSVNNDVVMFGVKVLDFVLDLTNSYNRKK